MPMGIRVLFCRNILYRYLKEINKLLIPLWAGLRRNGQQPYLDSPFSFGIRHFHFFFVATQKDCNKQKKQHRSNEQQEA